MTIPVTANPHIPGWPARQKADGSMTVPGPAQYLPPAQAFAVDFDTDAHFQACSAPQLPHRLTYDALPALERGASIVPFVVDVDAPEHGSDGQDAVESWWRTEQPKVDQLLATHAGGLVYRTRGGYRIVYRFDPPHAMRSAEDGAGWRMFYTRSLLYLWREFRIAGDPACKDWTRLYRLPHATREPKAGPERRDVIGDTAAIGVWSYVPTDVDADLATARELGDGKGPWQAIRKALEALNDPPRPQAEATAPQYDGSETRRARKALDSQCEAIASAPKGSRHATIYGAAADLGHIVCGHEIDEQVVVSALFDAAERSGEIKDYGKTDVERCINDGLAFGKLTPPRQPLKTNASNGNGHSGGYDWTAHYAAEAAENEAPSEDSDRFADAEYDGRPPSDDGTSSDRASVQSGDPSTIVAAWRQEGALVRYATGVEPLDKLCRGGLPFPWRMVIVGAPSAGKTYLLVCIAFALLKRGVAVGLLCVDEEPEDILLRFGVLLGFSEAELEERGEDTLVRLSQAMADLPLRLYDASDGILTAAANLEAFRKSRRLAHAMLGVDSLQAVTPSTQADTPRAIVEANVRDVRAASHQYRHLVLATSEANRAFYKSRTPDADDAVGAMAAGAESRAVEFGFKTLLGVLTPKGHNDVAEVEIAKNRRHHRGRFWLRLERDTHTATECSDPTDTPEAAAQNVAPPVAPTRLSFGARRWYDEVARWWSDDASSNPASEVLAALRPAWPRCEALGCSW